MAFLAGRMIWEFGYRRSKMEKIYRRIRTVYTIANTGHPDKGTVARGAVGRVQQEVSCSLLHQNQNQPNDLA